MVELKDKLKVAIDNDTLPKTIVKLVQSGVHIEHIINSLNYGLKCFK